MPRYVTRTKEVAPAASSIASGRVVAFPTNTSYGLAVDALQGWALQRLRILKGRPSEKTFTVCMAPELLTTYVALTKPEQAIWEALDAQPLTLLVKPRAALAHLAVDGLVGLRMIDHPLMAALAAACHVPLTATSANRAGDPPCFSPDCIMQTFPTIVPDVLLNEVNPRGASGTTHNLSLATILDGGDVSKKNPTTIAKVVGGVVEIVRAGTIAQQELQAIVDK